MKKKDILLKLGKAILIVSFFIVGFLVAKMIFSLFRIFLILSWAYH